MFFLKLTCFRVCVVTVCFLLSLGVSLLHLPEPEPFTHQANASVADEERGVVTLLIWTHPFSKYRELPDCWALYQIDGCALTDDWRAYRKADAVLIHHRDIAIHDSALPTNPRPPAQKWIWMNYESPTHTRGLWRFEDVFNLTMSYRTDSDIFLPYGYLIPHARLGKTPCSNNTHPLHRPSRKRIFRPRLVVWVISNWSESQARVAFYHRLRRYIQVDVYGRAGHPLPQDSGSGGVVRLVTKYQFYLALENSQHTDYITEKLWNAVRAGAVPIVMGPPRRNYERFMPPEAFIHVDDFPTARELARYLLLLKRNPVRLMRHLDWRGSYCLRQPAFWAEHYCVACRAVRRTRDRTNVVRDIEDWFHS